MTPQSREPGWQVSEVMADAVTSPAPVARITMPPMVAYSKVILQDERTRLHLLEQQCRAQEAMLAEKNARQQITEAGEANGLRIVALEQQLKAQEAMMVTKDQQVEKLSQLVETAKASMQELGTEADRESQELQKELEAAQAELQEARLRLQEMEAREKVKDCDASADAMEVLRAEAQRLAELQEQRRGEAELRRERLDAELLAARTALRREGIDWDGGESAETQKLRALEEELQKERQDHVQTKESLKECKEVAASLMADRDATRQELEELTRLATAFKKQAEGEISDHRWFRLVSLLRRDLDSADGLKESWSRGVKKWQSLADALSEKINQRPTAVFAQELSTHCSKGDKALQSLEEKWSSQGKQLAALAERALEKLRVAEEAMEAQLRDRLRHPEATPLENGKVDLLASLEAERKEVTRLQGKLSEAEQTIGQLVVQSIDSPKKLPGQQAKKPSSLRSRTRSALM